MKGNMAVVALFALILGLFMLASCESSSQDQVTSSSKQVFEEQLLVLMNEGVDTALIDELRAQKEEVLATANREPSLGGISFLPVIPMVFLGYRYEGISFDHLRDTWGTPAGPYYIFDVDDGLLTLDLVPLSAKIFLQNRGRRGLVISESIALIRHTDTISRHAVWVLESQWGNYVPLLYSYTNPDTRHPSIILVHYFVGLETPPHHSWLPLIGSPSVPIQ